MSVDEGRQISTWSKLRHRLVIGTCLAALAAAGCYLDLKCGLPGQVLFPIWFLFVQMAVGELVPMLRAAGLAPHALLVHAGVAGMLLACASEIYADGNSWDDSAWTSAAFGLTVIAAFIREVWGHTGERGHLPRLAGTILAVTYLGWPSVCVVWLRQHHGHNTGMLALVSMVVGVKLADVGAFCLGKAIGKTKVAPKLSPGKTWEGVCGGLLGALLGMTLVFHQLGPRWLGVSPPPPWPALVVYGVLLTSAGLMGDLAESMLKREAGWKDSSRWLPGLGGFLDILDSLLLAAPVAWACWRFGLLQV